MAINRKALAALLALSALAAEASAIERLRSTGGAAKSLSRSYTVRLEGGRTRTLWLDPDYVAELGPAAAADTGKGVKRYSSGARLHSEKKGMRVWKLGAGSSSLTGMSSIRSAQPGAKFSHVFRDGPASAGQPLVLNGRLIVSFQAGWDEARVRAWAASKGLGVVNKLAVAGNKWVLQAEPGISALEKANELSAGGEVLGAQPSMNFDMKVY